MKLFHGSKSQKKPNGVLSHFGSLLAATHRLESIFATQENRVFDGHLDRFVVIDYYGRPKRTETFSEALDKFIAHVKGTVIVGTELDIQRPLRLTDCWMDDPIGSGGLEIFQGNSDLSIGQRDELRVLFRPFKRIVYPQDVYNSLMPKRLNAIRQQNDIHFRNEFEKRRIRSLSIGEDFKMAAPHEAVWVDLTLKLRTWALQNGFDSFVYKNQSEGADDDAYVTLKAEQVSDDKEIYIFSEQEYLASVAPVFAGYLKEQWNKGRATSQPVTRHTDAYWGGQNPLNFWKKTAVYNQS